MKFGRFPYAEELRIQMRLTFSQPAGLSELSMFVHHRFLSLLLECLSRQISTKIKARVSVDAKGREEVSFWIFQELEYFIIETESVLYAVSLILPRCSHHHRACAHKYFANTHQYDVAHLPSEAEKTIFKTYTRNSLSFPNPLSSLSSSSSSS